MGIGLNLKDIEGILVETDYKPEPRTVSTPSKQRQTVAPLHYHLPEGPLVQLDEIVKCEHMLATNECPNPTYYALLDIPTCLFHALKEMNKMLHERGV